MLGLASSLIFSGIKERDTGGKKKKKKSVQRPPSRDDASSAFASSPGASDLVFPLQLPCLCQLRSRQAFMPRQATKAATTHPKSRQSHDPDGRLSPPSASLLNPPPGSQHTPSRYRTASQELTVARPRLCRTYHFQLPVFLTSISAVIPTRLP